MLVVLFFISLCFLLPQWALGVLAVIAAAWIIRFDSDFATHIYYQVVYKRTTGAFLGKTILLTGASSGLGEHLAYELDKQGAILILAARRTSELERVRGKCAVNGSRHIIMQLDVADTSSHAGALQKALAQLGADARIDILISNAGRTMRGLVEQCQDETKVESSVMQLNFLGTIHLSKLVQRHMIDKQVRGKLVFVSSIAGKLGSPGSAPYSASKAAVNLYADALRVECVAHGIKTLVVCPGPVVSEGADNAINSSGGRAADDQTAKPSYDKNRIPTPRFASLMAAAMHSSFISESWISKNPELLFTYLAQYSPFVYTQLSNKFGPKRCEQYRSGGAAKKNE